MTTKEIRDQISQSISPDWFNSVEVDINYNHIDFNKKFLGFSSLHKFFDEQISGFEKYDDTLPKEIKESVDHFEEQKKNLENFINSHHNKDENELNNLWNRIKNQFQRNRNYFIFDSPKTEFLIDLYKKLPNSYQAGLQFIIGNTVINSKNELIGTLIAYDFESKDLPKLNKTDDIEISSIEKIRKSFRSHLIECETHLTEHLSNSNKKYLEYVNKVENKKNEHFASFDNWFDDIKTNTSKFYKESKDHIQNLEKTYEELLRLKKPADYWKNRANTLKKEGWDALYWLVGLVVFVCVSLYFLLWLTPDGILLSFIEDKAKAIKWSIVYITFISFLAYGIRTVNKVVFSSFHLARDAEEREQLTYLYLSLLNDKAVDEKDRNLVLQSLFSRADTGLLKDDSAPTMPSDITSKIFPGNLK